MLRQRQRNQPDDDKRQAPSPRPPLPSLPVRRPITPLASTSSTAADNLVATLGAIARLPPEVRRLILVAAFGGRTLHLDIRLAPRGQRPDRSDRRAKYEHGRGWAPLSRARCVEDASNGDTFLGSTIFSSTISIIEHELAMARVSTEAELAIARESIEAELAMAWEWEWRWYGCVCHRNGPCELDLRHTWAHGDGCLSGDATYCERWPSGPMADNLGGDPRVTCDCAIGALGWLRSCRQAYIEGCEVLYATNTFFVESRDLLDALCGSPSADQRLLVPQHLAMITSLEVRLEVRLFGTLHTRRHPYSPGNGWDRMNFLPAMAGLAVSLPHLRSLVVSFSDYLYSDASVRPSARLSEINNLLLRPLALAFTGIASRRGSLLVVELPAVVFKDLGGLELEEEQREEEGNEGRGVWLRYPIDDSGACYYIKHGVESDLLWDCEGNLHHTRRTVSSYAVPSYVIVGGPERDERYGADFDAKPRTENEAFLMERIARPYICTLREMSRPWKSELSTYEVKGVAKEIYRAKKAQQLNPTV